MTIPRTVSTSSLPGSRIVTPQEFIERFSNGLSLTANELVTDVCQLVDSGYDTKEVWIHVLHVAEHGACGIFPLAGRFVGFTSEGAVLEHPRFGRQIATWSLLTVPPRISPNGDGFAVRFIPAPPTPRRMLFSRFMSLFH